MSDLPPVVHPPRSQPDWLGKVVITGLTLVGLLHFTEWWLSSTAESLIRIRTILVHLLT
jgi:hypothetical protein